MNPFVVESVNKDRIKMTLVLSKNDKSTKTDKWALQINDENHAFAYCFYLRLYLSFGNWYFFSILGFVLCTVLMIICQIEHSYHVSNRLMRWDSRQPRDLENLLFIHDLATHLDLSCSLGMLSTYSQHRDGFYASRRTFRWQI